MHKFFDLLISLHLEHFSSQIGVSLNLSVLKLLVISLISFVTFIFANSVFVVSALIVDSDNLSDSVISLENAT